jgi:outer membrane protein TolC
MVDGVAYPFSSKMKSDGASAMVMLSVPIWNWGMGKKSVKKAKLDVLNAQLDLQRNQRLLAIQARSAVKNVQNGYLQVQTAQLGAQQSDENLRVMNDRYENAMSTLTDLLDAQSQWQQAQSNLIEAQTQYKIYQTEYLKAVGRLE